MTPLYKLTDIHMRTYQGFQWEIGKTVTVSGRGELCGPGYIHAYTDPYLAVLLNPIHANIAKPRLFRGVGRIGKTDCGLKVGCTLLTLQQEMPLPPLSITHRITFAIYCAFAVADLWASNDFVTWAEGWLSGNDQSHGAAWAAEAAADAAWAAWAAEAAAWAAAWAAAKAAAEAAAKAADAAGATLPLIDIAHAACADLFYGPKETRAFTL